MEVIVLGSGTSQGVPMIGCGCPVCTSADPRNRRTRASVHVVMDGLHVQVDAAPEFRLQCLGTGVDRLDLFILTHGHADHVAGMDDLRRFCDLKGGQALPIYSTKEGMARVLAIYPYAITDRPIVRGLSLIHISCSASRRRRRRRRSRSPRPSRSTSTFRSSRRTHRAPSTSTCS